MVEIDWGDLAPSAGQRARVEQRLGRLAELEGPSIGLRRKGGGYEAQLTSPIANAPVELRLHGDDLGSVIDRAVDLLAIVTRERPG